MATEEMTGRVSPLEPEPALGPPRGSLISRFIVIDWLGAGGMGLVLSAYDPVLDRKVAIKLVRPDLSTGPSADVRTARLIREGQAMAKISHRNVVAVHEVGSLQDQIFIAMELVDGAPLTAWLREPRSVAAIRDAFLQAGRGLEAAHALGLVHRDFKPDNVLVARDGRVLVTDFGVAALAGADSAIVGTRGFMAPEQETGTVDARADQYAFCTAFAGALGDRAPRWLRPLLERGRARRPEERHPSMTALLEALERGPLLTPARLGGAAALVVAAGALVLGARGHAATPPCQGAATRLAGVWDDPTRKEIEAAFTASGHPDAAGAFRRLATTLDRYTGSWVATRTDACLATAVRGEQSPALLDLRMRCLDQRLGAVAALTHVYRGPLERLAVARAAESALGLEPLDGCSDAAALTAAVPPPADAATRAWVDGVERRLERAVAFKAAGRVTTFAAVVPAVAAEARATGYDPLIARALGRLAEARLDVEPAAADLRPLLEDAVAVAARSHDDGEVFRDLSALVNLLVDHNQDDAAAALRPALVAAAERAGGGDALEAELHATLGIAAHAADDYAAAERELLTALQLSTRASGLGGAATARIARSLGRTLNKEDKCHLARAVIFPVLAAAERTLGPDNPLTGGLYATLGEAAGRTNDSEAGIVYYTHLLAIAERSYGPMNLHVVSALSGLAVLKIDAGQPAEALRLLERAVAIATQVGDPDAGNLSVLYSYLGDARAALGRTAEARTAYEQELALVEKAGPESSRMASALADLGYFLFDQGQYAEALPILRRCQALSEKTNGPDHAVTKESTMHVGAALVALHRGDEGLALLERAWALEAARPSESPGTHAVLAWSLAQALGDLRRTPARAVALAREARSSFVAAHLGQPTLGQIDAFIARHGRPR